jgi:hypothetical protein
VTSTRIRIARLLLRDALVAGIHVGVAPDGSEVILVAPLRVPRELRCQFEEAIEKYHSEVIAVIMAGNAMTPATTNGA